MPINPAVESAIRRVADQYGIDPSLMMAIAQRESSFDVRGTAPGSSAYGLFQLLRAERAKYGGSSQDPEEQATAWANYIGPVRNEMARTLGRDPTGPELYLGHYWGGGRAARFLAGKISPEEPVQEVFSPQELAANPNFGRAGTVGNLGYGILADIQRRQAKFGGGSGWSVGGPTGDVAGSAGVDLSRFGEDVPDLTGPNQTSGQTKAAPAGRMASLDQFGEDAPDQPVAPPQNIDQSIPASWQGQQAPQVPQQVNQEGWNGQAS